MLGVLFVVDVLLSVHAVKQYPLVVHRVERLADQVALEREQRMLPQHPVDRDVGVHLAVLVLHVERRLEEPDRPVDAHVDCRVK